MKRLDAWTIAHALSSVAAAQTMDPMDEPLVTDRPDFTESTEAVPAGHFQLEAGYTFTLDDEDDARVQTQTAPELLLRVGLAENLELRLGWEGYDWSRNKTPASTDRGSDEFRSDDPIDAIVGFKLKLFEQDGWRPHFGVIVEAGLPTGGREGSSSDVDPAVKFLWAYDLSDRWSLAGNVNFAVPTEDGSRFFQTAASLAAGYAINDRWGAYAEYFGFYNDSHHTDAAHTVNCGVTYLVTGNFQLDLRIGLGLNEEADDSFTGVGFAYRF